MRRSLPTGHRSDEAGRRADASTPVSTAKENFVAERPGGVEGAGELRREARSVDVRVPARNARSEEREHAHRRVLRGARDAARVARRGYGMTEQTARRIEKLLIRLLAVLDPHEKAKAPGGASVGAFNRATGDITDADGDVPSALTVEERRVMAAQDKHGRLRPGRRT